MTENLPTSPPSVPSPVPSPLPPSLLWRAAPWVLLWLLAPAPLWIWAVIAMLKS